MELHTSKEALELHGNDDVCARLPNTTTIPHPIEGVRP